MQVPLDNFVVFGVRPDGTRTSDDRIVSTQLHGYDVRCGLVPASAPPAFDPRELREHVLVRTRAFSLNFRDKVLLLSLQRQPRSRYSSIGSDFVADVVAVGDDVGDLDVGARVMGNNHYPVHASGDAGHRPGIPSNVASRRYQILHRRQLARVPASMPDSAAASFSINAQTAFSICRKAEVQPGMRVLVTSARANTSLACISALQGRGAEVYASSTSPGIEARLNALGIEAFIPSGELLDPEGGARFRAEQGYFDLVVDPFFDLHLEHAVEMLRPGGAYFTCGMADSVPEAGSEGPRAIDMRAVMMQAILKNLRINGNCLGLSGDLEEALRAYEAGRFSHVVDAVFEAGSEADFLERTFASRERVGKVVYRYTDVSADA